MLVLTSPSQYSNGITTVSTVNTTACPEIKA
jgi:hypothetical protein